MVETRVDLLDLDSRAGVLETLLQRFGLVLGNAFLHRLRRILDERLGFLEAEIRDRPDLLDDGNLAGAEAR